MIDYEDALQLVLERATVRTAEAVSVYDRAACGRVLARDVVAGISSPPFDRSAMDGFAVRQQDVQDLPAELDVIGEVFAGQQADFTIGPGQAAVITTGAPAPPGSDMVVMVEDTERTPDGKVRILDTGRPNIVPTGEDVRAGDVVLQAGLPLTALRLGVAAAAGHAELEAVRRPSAALVCTGNEVIEPGNEAPADSIYNANGSMLAALLAPVCGEFNYLGIAGDDEAGLAEAFRRGLESDVLVISGGVSMGQYDLVPAALQAAGVEQVFHKVAIKPGKPTFFGAAGSNLVFGMPGNPQSCFVIFHMLVAPAVAAMSGRTDLPPLLREGVLGETLRNKPGRMNVIPCLVEERDGVSVLRRCPFHGSGDIVGPSGADAYYIVPRGTEELREGDRLRFFRV